MNPNSNSTILNPKNVPGATNLNATVMYSNIDRGAQGRQKLELRMRQNNLNVKWLAGIVCSLGQGIDAFVVEKKKGKPILTMEGGTLDTYEIVVKLHHTCGGVDLCSFSISGSEECFTMNLTYIDIDDMEEVKNLMASATGKKRKN
ncbi:uncharacterized protein LOC132190040 isoform X2 [Corylus avellana]|uniref:uncharacterized protein LOC132190040 isoform X2 n=1 Tax=Corylus avellana TaxID=13451 RepID=UPI00286C08C1|nr:uncharacterized protein LOC132190040 isoform X2 [Corylus avellana]